MFSRAVGRVSGAGSAQVGMQLPLQRKQQQQQQPDNLRLVILVGFVLFVFWSGVSIGAGECSASCFAK